MSSEALERAIRAGLQSPLSPWSGLSRADIAEAHEALTELLAALAVAREREQRAADALTVASADARLLVQDYYSGLPEHRALVMGAVARLALLFEVDEEGEPRTIDAVITDGLAARATLEEPLPPRHGDGHYDTCATRAGGPCDCPGSTSAAADEPGATL